MLNSISERRSLHMPAHFGKALFEYGDIFKLDTTELDVSDNLYNPSGAIKEAEELLAKSANVKNAYFLHDGSSAGIRAMLLYVKHLGNKIIIPRNSHISIYNFIASVGLDPVFAKLSFTDDAYPYTPTDNLKETIDNNPDAVAVLITSPDYYGVCMDIESIANYIHDHGMILLCDQAHGAHLNWNKSLHNAGYYGADIFVQSAHKSLPCLTSNAWLLNRSANSELILKCIQAIQTSSPSFINMMFMDDARAYMDEHYDDKKISNLVSDFENNLNNFKMSHKLWQKYGFSFDDSRIVIDCNNSADLVQQELQSKGIDIEMSDGRRIVCIISQVSEICKEQLATLQQILSKIDIPNAVDNKFEFPDAPKRFMKISDAFFADKELVELGKAEGRISGTIAGRYPPGIPVVAWGEIINSDIIEYLSEYYDKCFGIKNKMINCVMEK
ncbi:MAG: aminotransferase class V-fold PLP-dependent enzyme [Eubacteriales bacterium]|nr:aminotransferase class V-fold PLP-dependent enzyme [Eubacteriales bacterium]